ncbi:MAG TPA: ABC transporter permease subunit, partial [Pyrinomonadaceae bacterium]
MTSPVWAIAAREMKEHLRTLRLRLTLATTLVLVVLATLAGVINYRAQNEQYEMALARAAERLREATTWSEIQPKLVRPVAPLMILNAGFEAKEGRVTVATIDQIPALMEDSAVETPALSRFSGFDVTTVLIYLPGMLAILLSFDAVSGEKERGTLALELSNSITRWQLLSGKYLGGAFALAFSLALSASAALIVCLLGGVHFAANVWPRVALWFVVLLAYLMAMFLAGLIISVLTHRAAISLLVGMLAWFLLVIFIPAAAASAALQLRPTPSPYLLEADLARLADELEAKYEEAQKQAGPMPPSDGVSVSIEQGVSASLFRAETYEWMVKYYALRARLDREQAIRIFERTREYQEASRRQSQLATDLAFLSPATQAEQLANALTNTSRADIYHFYDAARAYRQALLDFYDANHIINSRRWITDDPPDA